jgi:hypothetical protein
MMIKKIGERALIPNSVLKPFEVLIGEWKTTGSHPYLPGVVLHGLVSIEWLEGGAFLIIRTEIDNPKFPDGIEIFGSDDEEKKFFMLHFDERGVSRKYDVHWEENKLQWWRDDPKFSQRFTITIEKNRNKMTSTGEMSQKGGAWEKDLSLTYERIK